MNSNNLQFRSIILQRFDEELTNDILVLASHFNGLLHFGVVKVSVKYNVVFQPRAIFEIQNSVDYYDEQQLGLGEEFYNELFEYIDAIIVNPFYKIHQSNKKSQKETF